MDCGEYQLISRTEPISRKSYKCIWCGQTIDIKTKYIHEISKFDCRLQNHHWHLECEIASNYYFKIEREYEFDRYDNERPINIVDGIPIYKDNKE